MVTLKRFCQGKHNTVCEYIWIGQNIKQLWWSLFKFLVHRRQNYQQTLVRVFGLCDLQCDISSYTQSYSHLYCKVSVALNLIVIINQRWLIRWWLNICSSFILLKSKPMNAIIYQIPARYIYYLRDNLFIVIIKIKIQTLF